MLDGVASVPSKVRTAVPKVLLPVVATSTFICMQYIHTRVHVLYVLPGYMCTGIHNKYTVYTRVQISTKIHT